MRAARRRWAERRVRSVRLADYRPQPTLRTGTHTVERAALRAIDAHNHLGRWLSAPRWMAPDVAALLDIMDRANVAAVVNLDGRWGDELEANLDRYDRAHPGRFVTFCHVDWRGMGAADFAPRAVTSLRRSAAAGAQGWKVWKDLGRTVRDRDGGLVLPDDHRLDDLWAAAGELGLPVLVHVADPIAYFQPAGPDNERLEELLRNRRDSWHGDEQPDHARLLDALEAVIARHPATTFIGPHVANCAEDLGYVRGLLERYPNLWVDLAGRMAELGRQPRAAAALIVDHQDRILFGSDTFPVDLAEWRRWFRFLETADEHFPYSSQSPPRQGRWAVSALELPPDVLAKVYAGNARRLFTPLAGAPVGGAPPSS